MNFGDEGWVTGRDYIGTDYILFVLSAWRILLYIQIRRKIML
jgi:hypothetical protein